MIIEVSKGQQITLPADIRRKYDLDPGTKIEIEERDDEIALKPITNRTRYSMKQKKYPCNLTPEQIKAMDDKLS